jgi:hypothetical protein
VLLLLLLLLLLDGLTLLHQAETPRCSKQWGGLAVFRNCLAEDSLCLSIYTTDKRTL